MKELILSLILSGCATPIILEKPINSKQQENTLPWLTSVQAGIDYQLDSAANPDILQGIIVILRFLKMNKEDMQFLDLPLQDGKIPRLFQLGQVIVIHLFIQE